MSGLTPWRETYLTFGRPPITAEDRAEVLACLDSGWIGTGPRVARLEAEFARYIGARHAVATNSCTAALFLSLRELRLPPKSEVLTSSLTFCASANAIVQAGLTPVFVDCDRVTMTMDPADVERRLSPRATAILPVHYAGRLCEMSALSAIAAHHKLAIVEDCAHAIETTAAEGVHAGRFGRFGCFSFYVNKNVTTAEGGMIVTDDPDAARRLRSMTMNGVSKTAWDRVSGRHIGIDSYDVLEPSLKMCMTDIGAALGLGQLARVEVSHAHRQQLARFYDDELRALPLILPAPVPAGQRHALHVYTCLVDDTRTRLSRDQIVRMLDELKIGSGIHYPPVHLLSYYRRTFDYEPGMLPNTESIAARTFSLPFSPGVSAEDAADVVKALRLVFEHG
jgi:dTDP-4-amino-4,6-dideoxygalactose transaminase